MTDDNPSVLCHVSLGTNDFNRAAAFYNAPSHGCFVRDRDGNKIEATFWDTSAG